MSPQEGGGIILIKFWQNFCRMEPVSKSNSIREGLQARVKDPLWMAARQWQMGEFRARNGGHPVRIDVIYRAAPLDRLGPSDGGPKTEINLDQPLESIVESDQRYWDPSRFKYLFSLTNPEAGIKIRSQGYDGDKLDWYDFTITSPGKFSGDKTCATYAPSQINYKGRPSSRWWELEDQRVNFNLFNRPSMNYLLMALVEFAVVYSNDWIYVPLNLPVGYMRNIEEIKIRDSFGYTNTAEPVVDTTGSKCGWEAFTLSVEGGKRSLGNVFFLPNNLSNSVIGEPLEQVDFFRDESANLVWAIEHKYAKTEGGDLIISNRDDEERKNSPVLQTDRAFYWDKDLSRPVSGEEARQLPATAKIGPLDVYLPNTFVPANWIPFVPVRVQNNQIKLIQAELSDSENKIISSFYGNILAESKEIFEECIPKTGITIEIVHELARDTAVNPIPWTSRLKKTALPSKSSGLEFDFIIHS